MFFKNNKKICKTIRQIDKNKLSSLITVDSEIALSKEHTIKTLAMVDMGSTKSVIKEELVPEKFRQN